MMNRFSFRVWCKNHNEWEADHCVLDQDGKLYQAHRGDYKICSMDNHIVQFSTGLPDKTGKMIFEGDIVEHYGEVFKVGFENGCFMIYGISTRINPDGSEYQVADELLWDRADVLEIIGNAMENPKILEAANEDNP